MIKYKYNLVKSKFSLCCYNYLQSKSKTLLCLIAGGGEGKTEEMGLGEVGRLAECRGWGGDGLDWHCQTEHFNWKPCSEHCIRSGCSPRCQIANVRNSCTFPIPTHPPLILLILLLTHPPFNLHLILLFNFKTSEEFERQKLGASD